MLALSTLLLLLIISIISDFKSRRIPNSLICIGMLSGLLLSGFNLNGDVTLLQSTLGIVVGLLMLLPGYLLGKMGAGDIKLLAMCGSYLGAQTTLMAGLCTLVAGGFFALIWVVLIKKIAIKDKRYPYASAIAAGVAVAPYVHFA